MKKNLLTVMLSLTLVLNTLSVAGATEFEKTALDEQIPEEVELFDDDFILESGSEVNLMSYPTTICKGERREVTLVSEGGFDVFAPEGVKVFRLSFNQYESVYWLWFEEVGFKTIHFRPKKPGKVITFEVNVQEHTLKDEVIIRESTCSEEGIKEYYCTQCCETIREKLPLKPHLWDEKLIVDKEPTCTENGKKSVHCSVCSQIKDGSEETIPMIGHTWKSDLTIDKQPTCEDWGQKSIHCSVCETIKEGSKQEIPASGHEWDKGVVIKEPTSEEDGVLKFTCFKCHETKEESIAAIRHEWDGGTVIIKPTCTVGGKKYIFVRNVVKQKKKKFQLWDIFGGQNLLLM